MLLLGLPEHAIASIRRRLDVDLDANEVYRDLKLGKGRVFLRVDEATYSVAYECLIGDRYLGINVKLNHDIVDLLNDGKSLSNGKLDPSRMALALYLYESEKSADEGTLQRRYGQYYEQFKRFANLTPVQIKEYLTQKSQLQTLINTLRETKEEASTDVDHLPAELILEIHLNENAYASDVGISFNVSAGEKYKNIAILALNSILQDGETLSLATTNKKPSHFISELSFSEEDRRVLQFLPRIMSLSTNWLNKSTKQIEIPSSNEAFFSLLRLYKGKKVIYNGVPYEVDKDDQMIKVYIDEDGSISSSFVDDTNSFYLNGKNSAVHFNHETKHITFLAFASKKSKVLYEFIAENPTFNYEMFTEEIGGFLLPHVSGDTIVDQEFEEKTKNYRASIKYFLTYNDDLSLSMSTTYSIRGVEVPRDEFLLSPSASIYEDFTAELAHLGLEEESIYMEAELIAPVLEADFSKLSRICSLYLSDNLANKKVYRTNPIRVVAESGIDWFNLSYQSDTLSPAEIQEVLNAYRKKKKYVRIGQDYYALDNDELRELSERYAPEVGLTSRKLPIYQALRLNHEGKSIVTLTKQLMNLFRELGEYPSLELPLKESLLESLRPYQLDGVRWLYNLASHHLAGILADDMGLGKSLELISFLSLLEEKEPVLIISPKSLIYNWKGEFNKWDPSRDVIVFAGTKSDRKIMFEQAQRLDRPIMIVSYDTIRNDEEIFAELHYSCVILDEGQYIANAFAQKSKAVKNLKSKYRFVLTGTPIQNSFMDLWSIFDFLLPGYFEEYKSFYNIYRGYESVHSEEGRKLEKMIAPFILRRRKDDVLQDLPPKSEEITRIQFGEKEAELYAGYLGHVKRELKSESNRHNKIAMLAMLMRLRQLCVDPSSFLEYEDVSTKLEYTLSMIQNAIDGGHKVLIFSTFAEILHHLSDLLEKKHITHHMIYGQTSAAKRISYADDFNENPNVRVMLVSLKAGGTGLNLIGADIVIHLDPWWNLAAEEQATDRAYRIGQTRPVSVYKLIMVGSIEEKVIELQEKKKDLTSILHSEGEVGASLSEEDLYYLLG